MNAEQSIIKPLPATSLNAVQFLLAVACRFLQGFAPFVVMLASAGIEAESFPAATMASVCAAAVLCGMGLSVASDRFLVKQLGQRAGCLAAAMLSIVGLAVAWIGEAPEYLLSASALIGLGVGHDWSSVSDVARQSLSTTFRWHGMRIWTTAFAVGMTSAVLIGGDLQTAFYVADGIGIVVFAMLLFTQPSIAPTRTATDSVSARETRATSEIVATSDQSAATSASADASECDATECCGGVAREFRPTSFGHGVLIAVVGFLALWGPVGYLATKIVHTDGWGVTGFAIGLPAGYLLMLSVAPRLGYAVVLLLFLLLSAMSLLTVHLLPTDSRLLVPAMIGCGLFAAGVVCGISSLLGELFSDCPTDAVRSRVVCMALFASSALMSAVAVFHLLLQSEHIIGMLACGIFIVGMQAVRRLPSPMISSLGRDEPADADDEELNDVMAALNN